MPSPVATDGPDEPTSPVTIGPAAPPPLAPPVGAVTFLFTDIEGSTRLWQTAPDAMQAAVVRHDALLRNTIERHGGFVFKTVGDAFCAVFAGPSAGLAAAIAAQRALAAEPWPDGAHLNVRIALHHGEAEVRAGDYFGTPLSRVARLLAAGHGGQVLLTDSLVQLIADHAPPETSFADLGAHRLKDLSRDVHVFQLRAPGLASDFPPLHTLDRRLHNLPVQLTSLVGRQRELESLSRQLGETRLLTLTGIGGSGKTRLALQLAAEAVDHYADGAWLVELAPVVEARLLPTAVATVLGLREEPGRAIDETLVDHLKARRLLLLLDNCEHLLEPCARLADRLLGSAPGLSSLATSREALGISGEITWPVPTLSLPDLKDAVAAGDLAAAAASEAVQLFVERAKAVQPRFELSAANVGAVARICRQLDGIPLAIELAAARVRVLAPEQIAQRLDDRFRLLTGGNRLALPHHQTLLAALDWSHELLDESERTLFRRLAVFRGGWTLDAAEAIASGAGIDDWEVLDLMAHLVDKSLVVAEDKLGFERYHFLETVRHYARDKLEGAPEANAVADRHLAFFLALAEEADRAIQGPEQERIVARLATEHDNLRAAIERTVSIGNATAGLRFGAAWWFWYMGGHWSEGRARLESLLGLPGAAAPVKERADALTGAGVLATHQGDYAPARAFHEEGLAIRRQLGIGRGIASSLANLGNVANLQGDYGDAIDLYAESLSLMRQLGDQTGIAALLSNLGTVANFKGDFATARDRLTEGLALQRQLGDKHGIADTLSNLGLVAANEGDYALATTLLEESLAIRRDLGVRHGLGAALGCLGQIAAIDGQLSRASALFDESLALRTELGDRGGRAETLDHSGQLAAVQGDVATATACQRESLLLRQELGDQSGVASSLESFGRLAAVTGDATRAVQLLGAADARRSALGIARLGHADARHHDATLAAVSAALGADAFKRAWSEGRAMGEGEAVALALGERQRESSPGAVTALTPGDALNELSRP